MDCIDLVNIYPVGFTSIEAFRRIAMPIALTVCVDGSIKGALAERVRRVEVRKGVLGFKKLVEKGFVRLSFGRLEPILCTRLYTDRDGRLYVEMGCVSATIVIEMDEPLWRVLGFESLEQMLRAIDASRHAAFQSNVLEEGERIDILNTLMHYAAPRERIDPYPLIPLINRRPLIDSSMSVEELATGSTYCRVLGVRSFDEHTLPGPNEIPLHVVLGSADLAR